LFVFSDIYISINFSKDEFLFLGGVKLILFLTSEASFSSSFPLKYSASRSLLLNSFISLSISSVLLLGGVVVNLRPLLKMLICGSESSLLDIFNTFILILAAF
jgi:hypothetical protein